MKGIHVFLLIYASRNKLCVVESCITIQTMKLKYQICVAFVYIHTNKLCQYNSHWGANVG